MSGLRRLLIGERVRLTAVEPADHAAIADWSSDGDYIRNLRTGAASESVEQVAAFAEREAADTTRFGFAIRLVDAPGIIGIATIKDIEWSNRTGWLALGIGSPEHRDRGLGSETVRLLVEFAFGELNLHRLGLTVATYNQRAVTVYERIGFVREGVVREAIERDGNRHDLLIYGLLSANWTRAG